MVSLQGKVALITGGSSGIGRAAAHAFARAGASVVLAARGAERGEQVIEELRAEGGEGRFLQAEVSRGEDVDRLLQSTVAAYGRLDAAFNNAATADGAFALTADFSRPPGSTRRPVALLRRGLVCDRPLDDRRRRRDRWDALVPIQLVPAIGLLTGEH